MPTKTARRDYKELLPGFVMSHTLINPTPRNMGGGGGEASLANHNTLRQLTSLNPLCISEGGAS